MLILLIIILIILVFLLYKKYFNKEYYAQRNLVWMVEQVKPDKILKNNKKSKDEKYITPTIDMSLATSFI